MSPEDGGLIAAGGMFLGGIAVKAIERYIWTPAQKQDDARQFRAELREEVRGLRDRTRNLENELMTAKDAVIRMLDHSVNMRAIILQHREDIDELRERAGLPRISHPALPVVPVRIDGSRILAAESTPEATYRERARQEGLGARREADEQREREEEG